MIQLTITSSLTPAVLLTVGSVTKVLDDNFTILNGMMTTIHAYTSDQKLLDVAKILEDLEQLECL